MLFQKKQKCPQCGAENPSDARFCGQCRFELANVRKVCGACGYSNDGDAKFCQNCGQLLSQSEVAMVHQSRWVMGERDFATRIEADDLPGLLKKGVNVEAGTNGMMLENGANRGVVPAGAYTLSSFSEKFKQLFQSGLPKQLTILLTRITPTDLEFNAGGCYTKDPLKVGVTIRMQVEVNEPAKFLINVLRGRERYSVEELRQYLYPEVESVARGWIRAHTAEELANDISLKEKFELSIEETLKRTFKQTGLVFLQIRTIEMNLEVLDRINDIDIKYTLLTKETRAEAKGQKDYFDAQRELDLLTLIKETAKVEDEEKKAVLYERMRQAVLSDKMNEVRSEAQFKTFMREMDKDDLLAEKEKEEMLRTWREDAQDHDLARAHLLDELKLKHDFELKKADLKLRYDLDKDRQEYEIDLENKKLDYEIQRRRKITEEELQLERQKIQIANDRARAQVELDKLEIERKRLASKAERDDDEADAMLGMKILQTMKEIQRLDEEERRRIVREDEIKREEAKLNAELKRFEMDQRARESERSHELKKMEMIATFSTEQLISISPTEQGKILAELKRTETLKGMTEEQILAMAAEKSPEVARAFQERFRAIADGKASEREKEMYERLVGEQKAMLDLLQGETEKRVRDVKEANQISQETSRHAMDRLADTAQAFAKGGSSQPVIITGLSGGGSNNVVNPNNLNNNPAPATKICINCGVTLSKDAKFCNSCGHRFEGM